MFLYDRSLQRDKATVLGSDALTTLCTFVKWGMAIENNDVSEGHVGSIQISRGIFH